ncbi:MULTISPECIES: 50S ribosomal protein L22 [Chloroflexus]|jgi:large subunit ribosomal protein L22|uniref:Large ribosomal subunit protein uL22 n=2 Tax=Chloroflexus aggregans TaxID=152260 RepID=RL22_CHLAD|nr:MULTISPECIES: 50S ribosomal protein L22 [Chloroflexus]B8G6S0.1 RecName: Full=Large ribosomal subunit protein uL22; AltName: Full=50S ribosomal protein L22 [Chloroflexus aggregans DSM 9485]PMP80391.1 MAG: 50S ribosomal protein L22 [Chloroflexus aggregans]RMD81517.1 MAG: 50S ribosomal protein L22 [Chloroflexota bacterium]ACL25879.1 ribosomal protein L22 [Chloroflexus aggregans DSM 9485]GIV87779.1 MAG: 50S ribosomal protein L22 [Chloroflexus sp.]
MEAKAVTRYVRISPLKVRLVMDVVRGMPVDRALATLRYMPQKAAREVARTLKSAIANAEHNFDMNRDELYIKTIYADQGPVLKRFMPRARGMANRIRKPTTHITVVVADKSDY